MRPGLELTVLGGLGRLLFFVAAVMVLDVQGTVCDYGPTQVRVNHRLLTRTALGAPIMVPGRDDQQAPLPHTQQCAYQVALINNLTGATAYSSGVVTSTNQFHVINATLTPATPFEVNVAVYASTSVYNQRVYFRTFDVTPHLRVGENVLGVSLGNYKWGYNDKWCNMTARGGPEGCRGLIAILELIRPQDSSRWHLISDSAWLTAPGPISWDHLFHGETYDARLEATGWLQPGFVPPATWVSASVLQLPVGSLEPAFMPALRVMQQLAPVKISAIAPPSQYGVDFGLNMAGRVRMRMPTDLSEGQHVWISHGEIVYSATNATVDDTYCSINPNASALRHEPCRPHQTYGFGHETPDRYVGDFNDANMTNVYVVGSAVNATYVPSFAAAGFRHIMVQGLASAPTSDMFTAEFIHTDVAWDQANFEMRPIAARGTNSTQTPDLLNQIHHLAKRAQASNLWSIPTDCPQRERRGWMGDAQVSCNQAMMMFDMHSFYRKFLRDIRDDQLQGCDSDPVHQCASGSWSRFNGSVADVHPYDGIGGWPGCVVWQVAYVVIARNVYRFYGDTSHLVEHYAGLAALMNYLNSTKNPSTSLVDTAGYGEIATVLNRTDDARQYEQARVEGVAAYHAAYYNATVGGYNPTMNSGPSPLGSQTSNAMALLVGAPPDAATQARVAANLVADLEAHGNHSTGGVVGMKVLFPALSLLNRSDLALAVLLQDTYPSIGHMVAQGQTTLCESWACSEYDAAGASLNHIMCVCICSALSHLLRRASALGQLLRSRWCIRFGAFNEWLMEHVGGLHFDASANADTAGGRLIHLAVDAWAARVVGAANFSLPTPFGPVALQWIYKPDRQEVSGSR
ncbi:uncharacterized protein MONBRDRAFT_10744 [Monosiga brevicollis MX1]|uniref:alpha-L-rhamnosidase n=1 Tax=Monosiga brevicollis TaxID=81824 RepID=A9V740_MONBE|nr:uncharacterized protein MONBRDRAFT_10744 [Monosiga brevicollis MX1]EDQ86725.1 predicted protein [Monosiga brevicollis MX1]|eukprot:XP_001748561.1 hypothetical protein [Monosiga brevicollis MX1]